MRAMEKPPFFQREPKPKGLVSQMAAGRWPQVDERRPAGCHGKPVLPKPGNASEIHREGRSRLIQFFFREQSSLQLSNKKFGSVGFLKQSS
jgi:hypothetical protein